MLKKPRRKTANWNDEITMLQMSFVQIYTDIKCQCSISSSFYSCSEVRLWFDL